MRAELERKLIAYDIGVCWEDDIPLTAWYMRFEGSEHPALISEYIITALAARRRGKEVEW